MVRAVLDANVFVSALIEPEGPPGQVMRRLAEDHAFVLVTSPAILAEVQRAISRPRVRRYLSISEEESATWVQALAVVGTVVAGALPIRAVVANPDDDVYVGAAVEGLAEFIVSGDDHLLRLKEYGDIRILTPRVFLEILDSSA